MDMMRQGWLMGVCEALQQLSMMLPQDVKTRPVSQRRIATCTNPLLCGFLWDWLQACTQELCGTRAACFRWHSASDSEASHPSPQAQGQADARAHAEAWPLEHKAIQPTSKKPWLLRVPSVNPSPFL
jgi:hypothetical protein